MRTNLWDMKENKAGDDKESGAQKPSSAFALDLPSAVSTYLQLSPPIPMVSAYSNGLHLSSTFSTYSNDLHLFQW